VFDGSKVRIYVNGEEEGSEDYDGKILAGEGPISIGDNDAGQKMTSSHAAVESEGKLATTWGEIKIQY
jgi:hypothetical protein